MEMNEENIRNSDDRITEIRTGKRRDNKLSIVCSISKLRIQPVRNRGRVEPSKGHTLGKHTTQVRTPQGHTLKRITTGFRNRKPDLGLYAVNMLLKPWTLEAGRSNPKIGKKNQVPFLVLQSFTIRVFGKREFISYKRLIRYYMKEDFLKLFLLND